MISFFSFLLLAFLFFLFFFFFNDTATTEIYTLSLHDALPIITSIDAKITEWQRLYGTFVTGDLVSRGPDKPGGVSLFGQWLSLADRTLIDERDTAFHTAFGNRPALAGD